MKPTHEMTTAELRELHEDLAVNEAMRKQQARAELEMFYRLSVDEGVLLLAALRE